MIDYIVYVNTNCNYFIQFTVLSQSGNSLLVIIHVYVGRFNHFMFKEILKCSVECTFKATELLLL